MSNSLELLRMLEPAVRPGQSGSAPASESHRQPIEQRSFESLLQDVQTLAQQGEPMLSAEPDEAAGGAGKSQVNLLSPLSDLDAISNASLRELITRHHGAGTADHSSGNQDRN